MTSPASIGCWSDSGSELQQVGHIAVELAPLRRRCAETSALSPDPLRRSAPTRLGDRLRAAARDPARSSRAGRAEPGRARGRARTPAPPLRAGRAPARAPPGRADCRAAAAGPSRTGGVPSSRARPIAATTALPDLHRMELPFGRDGAVDAPAGGFAALEHQRRGGDVARRQPHRGRRARQACAARARRSTSTALQSNKSRQLARCSRRRCPASLVQDSSRRASPAIVALRAAWASAMRACRRTEAASWLVTSATANRTTTVTMSFGLSIRKVRCGAVKKKL